MAAKLYTPPQDGDELGASLAILHLTSRMPESGTSGSVGVLGGNSQGDPAYRDTTNSAGPPHSVSEWRRESARSQIHDPRVGCAKSMSVATGLAKTSFLRWTVHQAPAPP